MAPPIRSGPFFLMTLWKYLKSILYLLFDQTTMRIASIDIFRALTMLFMIWVNDFWTLQDVPKWLEHATVNEDYLGFSDIIFPLFLFIVGLSIPHALQKRLQRESRATIAKHILIRGLSLLLIGFFMVNYESIHAGKTLLGKSGWCLLMALGTVLIWTDWKRSPTAPKWHPYLQATGILLLLFLAVIYKGGHEGEEWMQPHWWGILGLIGWAYLVNALYCLLTKGNLVALFCFWGFLNFLSILSHSSTPIELSAPLSYFSTIYTGTIPAFTAAGMLTATFLGKYKEKRLHMTLVSLFLFGLSNIVYGLGTRAIWGISKLHATPSWLAVCTGIGCVLFVLLYYIADIRKITGWAAFIAPAGTATLTCYMVPYFVYPLASITGFKFPNMLNNATLGLLVSFSFAILVVLFTGWLERKGYKLKL